jgi:hypothetical protein
LQLGELIRAEGIPREETWAYTALGNPWVPNAWLTSVLMSWTVDLLGYRGLIAVTVLLSATLLGAVIWLAHRAIRSTPRPTASATVAVIAMLQLMPFLTARPQLVSLVLAVWLSSFADELRRFQRPRWWLAILIAIAWVHLHAMWVLIPFAMTIVVIARILTARQWTRGETTIIFYALFVFGAAATTPVGPRLAFWWVVVRDRAAMTTEWQPLILTNWYVWGFLILVVGIVASWALSQRRPGAGEVLWVLGSVFLAITAVRNVAPATIFLIPVAVRCLTVALPSRTESTEVARRWMALPIAAAAATASLLIANVNPVPSYLPDQILAKLMTYEGPVRVLNDFNVGGYLTGLGAPHVSVAIDGRIDLYEADFIDSYLQMVKTGVGADTFLDDYSPDAAVLRTTNGLLPLLEEKGWVTVISEGNYRLLVPPKDSP